MKSIVFVLDTLHNIAVLNEKKNIPLQNMNLQQIVDNPGKLGPKGVWIIKTIRWYGII